jgi:hypothetical protein
MRPTIKDRLKRLQHSLPKRDMVTGQLYSKASDRTRRSRKVTMYGLFVSDHGTFLLRGHLFETKRTPRTAMQWYEWFREHYSHGPQGETDRAGILQDSILPGINARTGKIWRLYRIIGWVRGDKSKQTYDPPVSRRRNKKKSQRRKNGRSNIRRG